MEYTFERFPPRNLPAPGPGEIHLRPRQADSGGPLHLSMLALKQGADAFVKGEGPIARLVIQADPTLDDMLAAAFLEQRLAGQTLPEGAEAFADYAGNVRDGLKTSDLPLKDSLEGTYLALRHLAGCDLTQRAARDQFLTDWSRMAKRILEAASAGKDPSTAPLFKKAPECARARSFLTEDRKVYDGQDVARGERWLMRLPEGPPQAVAGLLLPCPKSMLWKYWSRKDPEAPGGKGYLFLAVYEKEKHWRFSTDRVHSLPIKSLADELQKAEQARDPVRALNDPWYDGGRHGYTIIGAPHEGTALADDEVLRVVKRWGRARPGRERKLGWKTAAGVAVAAALLIGVLIFKWPGPTTKTVTPGPTDDVAITDGGSERGLEILDSPETERALPLGPRTGKDYALLFATDDYDADQWQRLTNPIDDAKTIASDLRTKYGFDPELVTDPTQGGILEALTRYSKKQYGPSDQLFIFFAGHGDFNSDNRLGYVVAKDSLSLKKDPQRISYLTHAILRDMIEKIECNHIFVVLDVCFGGTFDFGTATEKSRGVQYVKTSREEFVARKMKHKARRYITSGGKVTVPDGTAGQHSPFASKFIEALEKGDGDEGILTSSQIWLSVEKGKLEPQAGELRGNEPGGDFLFIKKQPPQ